MRRYAMETVLLSAEISEKLGLRKQDIIKDIVILLHYYKKLNSSKRQHKQN